MLSREPVPFDETDTEAEAAADAEAEADVRAGRLIRHEAISAWLASWGTPDRLPAPEIGD